MKGIERPNILKTAGKRLGALLAVLCLIFMTAGCGGTSKDEKLVYYLNHNGATSTFNEQLFASFKNKAESEGLKVESRDAKGDSSLQIDQFKEALNNGAGEIVVLAMDEDALVPFIQQAHEQGVFVTRLNREVNDKEVYGAISDDREAGRMQGEYMAKNLPPGANIVYLLGESANKGAQDRYEGFKETCLSKRSDVTLLDTYDAGWSEANALKIMSLWLKLYPKIDGVVGCNDDMALGAIRALKDAGRMDGVLVTGVDATDAALKALQEGTLGQTVKQDAVGQGEGAVAMILSFIQGNTPTDNTIVPYQSITKENIAQFVH